MPTLSSLIGFLDIILAYYVFCLITIAFCFVIIYHIKEIYSWIQENTPPLITIFFFFFSFCLLSFYTYTYSEFSSRVQSDESLFATTALNMAYNSMSSSCEEALISATRLDCLRETHVFKGKLWPFVLNLFIPYTDQYIQLAQLSTWILTWLLSFYASYSWTKNSLYALLIPNMLFSQPCIAQIYTSGGTEGLYLCLFYLTTVSLNIYQKISRPSLAWLPVLSFALFCNTRLESIFFLPLFLWIFISIAKKNSTSFMHSISLAFIFKLAISPALSTIFYFRDFNLQAGNKPAFGYLYENLLIAIQAFGHPPYIPQWFAGIMPLFLWGLYKVIPHTGFTILLSWIPGAVIFNSVSGDLTIIANHRYAVAWLPIIIHLAISPLLFYSRKIKSVSASYLLILIVFCLVSGKDILQSNLPYQSDLFLKEYREIVSFTKNRDHSVFIYSRPAHLVSQNISSIYVGSLLSTRKTQYLEILKKKSSDVYLLWGGDCSGRFTYHPKLAQPPFSSICREFLATYSPNLISEHSSDHFILYKFYIK